MRVHLPKHKVITLRYDEKLDEVDVLKMLKGRLIVKYIIEGNKLHIQYKKPQYLISWCDYKCGEQPLDEHMIMA